MILEAILIVLAIASAAVIYLKDLLHAVIVMSAADVVLALIFYLIAAPDIAITQVSVSGGLSTLIFIVALKKTRRMES